MKKINSIMVAFLLMAGAAFAQIPNAGFEPWNNMGSYSDPDQWGTLNSLTSLANTYTCLKGTPGNPGTAYLKLITKSVTGMGVVPGIAATGTLNLGNQTASGFAFASRPQNLTGSWQYMPATGDTGLITVLLSSWNTGTNKRDTVAFLVKNLTGMVMSWANFSLPLTYKSGMNPDTCVIMLSASKNNPVATSYLYVDNLAFSGTVAAIANYSSKETLELYPNPSEGQLFVNASSRAVITITDVSGKAMCELKTEAGRHAFDISSLSKGAYFVRCVAGETVTIHKLILQ